MSDRVLIIGATLFDIVGDYEDVYSDQDNQPRPVNKAGTIRYGAGGAGFNIATNLASANILIRGLNIIPSFITYLAEGSLGSEAMLIALKRSKISSSNLFVIRRSDLGEAGYIAHRVKKRVVSGVTSSAIHRCNLPENLLRDWIARSKVIAVDTNLSINQIKVISGLSAQCKRPLFMAIVSEEAAIRIASETFQHKFSAVSLNLNEARSIGFVESPLSSLGHDDQPEVNICSKLNSDIVFVTDEAGRYHVVTPSGSYIVRTPHDMTIVSTIGAGDAFFSALCAAACKEKNSTTSNPRSMFEILTDNEAKSLIETYIGAVLARESSNIGNLDISYGASSEVRLFLMFFVLLSSLLLSIGTLLFGSLYFDSPSKPLFWVAFFACACFTGIMGGIVRHISSEKSSKLWNWIDLVLSGMLGMVTGPIAAVFFMLPQLVTHNVRLHASGNETQAAEVAVLMFMVWIISAGSGFGSDAVLRRFRSEVVSDEGDALRG